jgi:hypothetical protein
MDCNPFRLDPKSTSSKILADETIIDADTLIPCSVFPCFSVLYGATLSTVTVNFALYILHHLSIVVYAATVWTDCVCFNAFISLFIME